MWDPYAEFETATLPNGLTVHAAHWPGRPWEAVGFVIHTGAASDPVGQEGLAHFVEHLVSSNVGMPRRDVARMFEDLGGSVNLGVTGYPFTSYGFFAPADKTFLGKIFSVFGEMLLSAKLEEGIERERKVIASEFQRYYPFKFNLDLEIRKSRALYAGCWLERFVRPFGNLESIERITQSDLQAHYDKYYTPSNISIVAVGGLGLDSLLELISSSSFNIRKEGSRTLLPASIADISRPLETRSVLTVSDYVRIDMPAEYGSYRSVAKFPGDINERAVSVLEDMLDEVLDEEIRERRMWTYSISTSWHDHVSFVEFAINCNSLNVGALDEIEDVIETCLDSIASQDQLFEQVKRHQLAGYAMIDRPGKSICDSAENDLAYEQRIITIAEYIRDIEALKMSDIKSLLQYLRPELRWTLIVKP